MILTFRPIDRWPAPDDPAALDDGYRKSRRYFKGDYNSTLRLLNQELEHLGAEAVMVQVAVDEADVRLDGRLRAHVAPRHPGVIVSFESAHGPLRYFTDEFESWRHNLRAIALGLEALRKVDRYGISRRGEQYSGWRELPPGRGDPSPERGKRLIDEHGGVVEALKATHPDRGGNPDDFADVQAAREAAREAA